MQRILFIFAFLQGCLFAQNLTLSPYSRYGVGDVFSYNSTRNAAMGGIGIGSTAYFSANRLNPASYMDLKKTTLDVSGFASFSRFSTNSVVEDKHTEGFRDLSFTFPSNKKMAFSFGFAPFSTVGYNLFEEYDLVIEGDTVPVIEQYSGSGGLNQFYLGGAFSTLKDKLRVGANLGYNFGTIQYDWATEIGLSASHQVRILDNAFINGISATLGIQYQDTLKKFAESKDLRNSAPLLLRVGATTDYNGRLKSERVRELYNIGTYTSVDTLISATKGVVAIPMRYGAGFELSRPLSWSVGADVVTQNWSNFQYFNDSSDFRNSLQVGVGGEWIPNFASDKAFKRISYRAGAYLNKTYLSYNNNSVEDKGITFGLGWTLSRRTDFNLGRLNLGVELGNRGNLAVHPMSEKYARIRFGITVNERWFVKRAID